jgi:hypothetical protein
MTVIDIQDDDALRLIQRVLESDAPEADRKAARDKIVQLRTRVREFAKPEVLPFAFTTCEELSDLVACLKTKDYRSQLIRAWSMRKRDSDIALFTAPRLVQRLTDEQLTRIVDEALDNDAICSWLDTARAIMDAMIEKNC